MAHLSDSMFGDVCRTCLTPSTELESLYEVAMDVDVSFAELLMSFTPLEFYEEDTLPTQICHNCIGELIRFNTFKWRCLETDATLRNQPPTQPPQISHNPNSSYIGYSNPTPPPQPQSNTSSESSDDSTSKSPKTYAIFQPDFKQPVKSAPARAKPPKLHNCKFCSMKFDRRAHLTRHIRMHTGEKPYTCADCGETFNNKSNLTVHRRKHTKEKPFACDICGSEYTQSNSLKVHMQTHEGTVFACDVCGKTFSRKTNLNRHVVVHEGEKPFVCGVCGEAFHRERLLMVHRRVHGGEVTFPCTVCGKLFSRKGHLTRHLKLHVD